MASAHDCSDGGLAVALSESCIAGGLGFRGDLKVGGRWDAALFGEAQSRVVVSLRPEDLGELTVLAAELDVPFVSLGKTASNPVLALGGLIDLPVEELEYAWKRGLGTPTTAQ